MYSIFLTLWAREKNTEVLRIDVDLIAGTSLLQREVSIKLKHQGKEAVFVRAKTLTLFLIFPAPRTLCATE